MSRRRDIAGGIAQAGGCRLVLRPLIRAGAAGGRAGYGRATWPPDAPSSSSRSRSTPCAPSGRRGPRSATSTAALPRAARGGPRRGGGGRPPPARLGVLARRAPARAAGLAARRPVLVPAGGGGAAEPAGLAARGPLLAARRRARGRLGVRPGRPPHVRRSPAGSRAGGCARSASRAPRRSSAASSFCLMPYRVGQSTGHLLGLDLVPPPGGAPRAGAAALRRRGRVPRRDPALRAAPPRARARSPSRSATPGRGLPRADWWKAGAGAGAAARRGPARRSVGGRGLDRHRPLLRPGHRYSAELSRLRHPRRSGAASRSSSSSAG